MSEVVIYRTENQIQVEVIYENDSLWLNQNQIGELFERDKSVISRHIRNIFKEGELEEYSTVAKNATVQQEGGRQVTRQIEYYNLDIILAVGYRVNSLKGTQFRIWANTVLKEYLVKGYAVNKKRLIQKEEEIQILKNGIAILGKVIEEKSSDESNAWLAYFAQGLSLLDDYDHERLDTKGLTKGPVIYPKLEEYRKLIENMHNEFDSDVFGREKDQSFASSLAQIEKGFDQEDFYPSIEEKGSHLALSNNQKPFFCRWE